MLTMGIKPGHDGAIAVIEDGRLLWCLESEKDSFPRYTQLTPTTLLDVAERLGQIPDIVALGGWARPRNGGPIGAGYSGEHALERSRMRFFGKEVEYFSSSHERSHIMMALGMAPPGEHDLTTVLVWEGVTGSYYLVDRKWQVVRTVPVLGNPGDRYAATRHNAGAMVVDAMASASGERFRKARFVPVESAELTIDGRKVWLAKSFRFMNESGPSYASIAKKHEVPPDHVIAVHDEIDLPFGALKVKIGGSTAGHNGLKSLQQALRTPDFVRVRVGVGRPPGRQDPADFVLQPFAKREEADVAILLDAAADAVTSLIVDGLAATQDKHNRSGARD